MAENRKKSIHTNARKSDALLQFLHRKNTVKIFPDVTVVKIGGQSIMDRGRAAVYPLVEELARLMKKRRLIITVGGGTRSRHAYALAVELGMPPGVLAKLGTSVSRQNARMLQLLLAPHGGVYIPKETFDIIGLYLNTGCTPIISGMPPYEYWEEPPTKGQIPECRTDVGTFLIGEVLGAKNVIFVKDEDGLYTDDPKKNPAATFIPRISVDELVKMNLPDLVVERKVLELMKNAIHIKSIRIVNGLVRGNLTLALENKNVGTLIYT